MPSASAATARLRASLDAIAHALQSANLNALLAAELELSAALESLGRLRGISPLDRPAVRDELARARIALSRCRTLGSVVDDVAEATLIAQGRVGDYDRAGAQPPQTRAQGLQLKARM
jgi:hypothetical protein